MSKYCPKCETTKLITEFYRRRDGYQSYCKSCHKATSKQWNADHPEAYKEYDAKWLSGRPGETRVSMGFGWPE